MIARVLERTGATVRSQGEIYKALTQLVLLYVSDSWLVTRKMFKILMEFHHILARYIMGMTAKTWGRQRVGVSSL